MVVFTLGYGLFCIVVGTLALYVYDDGDTTKLGVRRVLRATKHAILWTLPLFLVLLRWVARS